MRRFPRRDLYGVAFSGGFAAENLFQPTLDYLLSLGITAKLTYFSRRGERRQDETRSTSIKIPSLGPIGLTLPAASLVRSRCRDLSLSDLQGFGSPCTGTVKRFIEYDGAVTSRSLMTHFEEFRRCCTQ